MRRTDAVLAVLGSATKPMGPLEVFTEMRERGQRDLTYHVVQSTLQYLMNKGAVQRVDRGRYLLPA
jgi:hypothetical protein